VKIAVAMDGENRIAFGTEAQTKTTPCKVSSEDSGGHAAPRLTCFLDFTALAFESAQSALVG